MFDYFLMFVSWLLSPLKINPKYMLKKIAKFIKYNTLTVAIIAIAFVAVASAMADEDTRNKVIGEEIVEKSGVDNTALLAADLDNFDMEMKITGAMEDPPEVEDGNYYIDYQYKTLAIKDNVWQEVLVKKQMVVSKKSLAGRDLGLYVKEELGEIIDYQLAYLKKVQDSEEEKGRTVVLETTEYTGLIGMILDTKTKELPGYEPVVKPEVVEVVENEGDQGNQGDWEDQENWRDEPPLTPPSQEKEEDYPEVSAYQEWVKENVEGEIEEEEGDLGDGKEEEIVSEEEDEEKDEGEKGDLGNQGDGDLNDQGDNLEDQGDQEDLEEDQNEEELIQGDDEFSEEQLEEQLEESEQSGEEEASTDEDLGNQGNQRD